MIEVFKTNVIDRDHADMLIAEIHLLFSEYIANFDLDDCDKILRIQNTAGTSIQSSSLIQLLNDFGYEAIILPDEDNSCDAINYFSRQTDQHKNL